MTFLDTHVVVWLFNKNLELLSPSATAHIEADELMISPMVLLEMQYLFEIKRVHLPAQQVLDAMHRLIGVSLSNTGFAGVVSQALEANWTRDPFDRLIVAHAKAADAPLISRDEHIQANYQRVIW